MSINQPLIQNKSNVHRGDTPLFTEREESQEKNAYVQSGLKRIQSVPNTIARSKSPDNRVMTTRDQSNYFPAPPHYHSVDVKGQTRSLAQFGLNRPVGLQMGFGRNSITDHNSNGPENRRPSNGMVTTSYIHPPPPLFLVNPPVEPQSNPQVFRATSVPPNHQQTTRHYVKERTVTDVPSTDFRTEEELRSRVRALEQILQQLEGKESNIRADVSTSRALQSKLSECENCLYDANNRLTELQKQLDENQARRTSEFERSRLIEEERDRLQNRLDQVSTQLDTEKNILEEKLSRLTKDLHDYHIFGEDKDRRRDQEKSDLLKDLQRAIDENERLRNELRIAHEKFNEAMTHGNTKYDEAMNSCEELERQLRDNKINYDNIISDLNTQHKNKLNDLDEQNRSDKIRLEDMLRRLESDRDDYQRRFQELQNILQKDREEQRVAMDRLIQEKNEVGRRYNEIEGQSKADKQQLVSDMERIQAEKMESMRWLQDSENRLKQDVKQLKNELERAKQDRNDAARRNVDLEGKVTAEKNASALEIDRLNHEKDIAERRLRDTDTSTRNKELQLQHDLGLARMERDQALNRLNECEDALGNEKVGNKERDRLQDDLTQMIQRYRDVENQLKDEKESNRIELEKLRSELEQSQRHAADIDNSYQGTRAQILRKHNEDSDQLRQKLRDAEGDLENERNAHERTIREFEKTLQDQLTVGDVRLAEARILIEKNNKDAEDAALRGRILDDENRERHLRVENLERDREVLERQLTDANTQIRQMISERDRPQITNSEIERLRQEVIQHRNISRDLRDNVRKLEDELARKDDDVITEHVHVREVVKEKITPVDGNGPNAAVTTEKKVVEESWETDNANQLLDSEFVKVLRVPEAVTYNVPTAPPTQIDNIQFPPIPTTDREARIQELRSELAITRQLYAEHRRSTQCLRSNS